MTIAKLEENTPSGLPVLYAGDTVADMATIQAAKAEFPERLWLGVGILPPHVQKDTDYQNRYSQTLKQAVASTVLSNVEQLTTARIQALIASECY